MLDYTIRRLLQLTPFILPLGVAGVLAYQTTTTRGYVATSPEDRPIAGADVLLADSTRVIAHARTSADGRFRFIHPPLDRERHQILICSPGRIALRSSPARNTAFGLSAVEDDFFWTPDRIGWNLPTPPSCPGGEREWSTAGLSSIASSNAGGPMEQLLDAFGSLVFFLFILLLYAVPLLLIAWLIRTFIHMRRDQVRMLHLVSSIEVELRRRGAGTP